jgi:L-fuconolactonase
MKIDAHQHFWTLANPFTDWPGPDLAAIHRDFGPADLAPHLARSGVDGTVLVQAAPALAETHHMLELAARTPFVKAVVGWIDFDAADAIAQLHTLADHPQLKGLRPMLQSLREPGWILHDARRPVLRAMVARGLRFDALVRADQIGDMVDLAARHPDLPVVLDHGGKPEIAAGAFAKWARDIERLAAHPQVWCKLSGLWTQAGADHGIATIAPYARHLLACFGTGRVMWGSDWPVLELAGDYHQWFDQALALAGEFDASQIDAVMGGNAARFYGLDDD